VRYRALRGRASLNEEYRHHPRWDAVGYREIRSILDPVEFTDGRARARLKAALNPPPMPNRGDLEREHITYRCGHTSQIAYIVGSPLATAAAAKPRCPRCELERKGVRR
jgi:hypothetical protein